MACPAGGHCRSISSSSLGPPRTGTPNEALGSSTRLPCVPPCSCALTESGGDTSRGGEGMEGTAVRVDVAEAQHG